MATITLKQAQRKYKIPTRKLAYLIRKDIIDAKVTCGNLMVEDDDLRKYKGLPRHELLAHQVAYLKTLGPGIITGASDDDPSGIVTYSVAGAKYGLGLNWLAAYLLPMMTAVQETCARIGIVTGKGLTGNLSRHFGKFWLNIIIALLLIANTINIAADIGAMAVSVKLVFPPLDFTALAFGLTIFMILLEILFSYHQYSKILKVLTLSLLAYVITGIVIKPDWVQVLKSLSLPNIRFDSSYIAAMVGVMGTTISPYLFFWQTSEEVEEREDRGLPKAHQSLATHTEIKHMRLDTFTGMALANIAFLFIVITTAFVLNKNGITNIETAEQAALALKPMFVSLMGAQAGYAAFIMFALGMLGVGLLAVPVLAGSSAYGISELFKWNEGLSKKFGQARGFYLVIIISMIIGLLMNFIGISPIKALYFAAIVNGTIAPVLLFFIFKIGRDKEIMGEHTNPRWVNIFGTAATLLMGIAAIVLIVMLALGL